MSREVQGLTDALPALTRVERPGKTRARAEKGYKKSIAGKATLYRLLFRRVVRQILQGKKKAPALGD